MMNDYSLREVVWELTKKCNIQCIHCGSAANQFGRKAELSFEECLHLIDELDELNCEHLTVSEEYRVDRHDLPPVFCRLCIRIRL